MNKKQIIAYAGTSGSYGESAASRIFDGATLTAYPNFAAAFRSVESGECDCAVLPLENSYAGDVGEVIDLAFVGSLKIRYVCNIKIEHCLLGKKGVKLDDITAVASHQQALWQCSDFITAHNLAQIESPNTALAAARIAADNRSEIAVIASKQCAAIYNLDILAESIADSHTNITRFAVFSKQTNAGVDSNKFLMFFTVSNEAGSLGRAVSTIGKYGYNLRAIKSRPTKVNNWEYYFLAEGDGDLNTSRGNAMLGELSKCCHTVKVAGKFTDTQIEGGYRE